MVFSGLQAFKLIINLLRRPFCSKCPGVSITFLGLSLNLPWALSEPPLVWSGQVRISIHLGRRKLPFSYQLNTSNHSYPFWLQRFIRKDSAVSHHIELLRNALSQHGMVVVPGKLVIGFVCFSGSQTTCGTNAVLLKSSVATLLWPVHLWQIPS